MDQPDSSSRGEEGIESSSPASRLEAELSLLEAMYPSQVTFDPHSRDVRYMSTSTSTSGTSTASAKKETLVLRLPEGYPERGGRPELISAGGGDLRDETRRAIETIERQNGDGDGDGAEVLDQIIEAFEALVADRGSRIGRAGHGEEEGEDGDGYGDMDSAEGRIRGPSTTTATKTETEGQSNGRQRRKAPQRKTVVIWLHHLLAMSKRKLAVSPPTATSSSKSPSDTSISAATQSQTPSGDSTTARISGLTKPGYPGILIYSGASEIVDAHVRALKAQNWQAFQVRYDSVEETGAEAEAETQGQEWTFTHGGGKVVEVETMAEVVKAISRAEDRETFLRVVGVK